jgi:hypothetical protein
MHCFNQTNTQGLPRELNEMTTSKFYLEGIEASAVTI